MDLDSLRRHCLTLPGTTEHVQWGEHLVFKVAEKVYLVSALEVSKYAMTFKVTEDDFAELTEREGIVQAPYFAKRQWVALEIAHPLSRAELQHYIRGSYDLVVAKLPKKTQASLKLAKVGKQVRKRLAKTKR